VEVLNRIDELCVHLAATIRKSVLNLPTSLVRVITDVLMWSIVHRCVALRCVEKDIGYAVSHACTVHI
jgi:hypothetical protein